MPKLTPNNYLSLEQYSEAVETLHVVSGMLLFEFARHDGGEVREQILRHFIARAAVMARAIVRLWEIKDYHDCWILHRSLLDRLFHLRSLNERNEFDVFEAWSFKKQYEAIGRVKSDPDLKDVQASAVHEPTPEQRARFKELVKNPPVWRRPKAEDVAKAMDLSFLYKYGYDFASAHVHPMADDGQEDFYNITGLEPRPVFPEWHTVLSNSVLVASMIVQEALNASSMSWHKVVYDGIEGMRNFLLTGSSMEHLPVVELSRMFREGVRLSGRPGKPA